MCTSSSYYVKPLRITLLKSLHVYYANTFDFLKELIQVLTFRERVNPGKMSWRYFSIYCKLIMIFTVLSMWFLINTIARKGCWFKRLQLSYGKVLVLRTHRNLQSTCIGIVRWLTQSDI